MAKKGDGIASWTDIDYAQAAIDMLPDGSVEEIAEFLKVQRVKSVSVDKTKYCTTCPIAQWVNKWTDNIVLVGFGCVELGARSTGYTEIPLPMPAQRFILEYDAMKIRL